MNIDRRKNISSKCKRMKKGRREIEKDYRAREAYKCGNKITGCHFMQFSFKVSYCLNGSFLCFSFSRYFPPLLRGQRDKNCETFSERYGTKKVFAIYRTHMHVYPASALVVSSARHIAAD